VGLAGANPAAAAARAQSQDVRMAAPAEPIKVELSIRRKWHEPPKSAGVRGKSYADVLCDAQVFVLP
jgi:hypothetical protein